MWVDYLFEAFYDTIGGKGPTGADIGGSGANWGEEIGVVDWIVDAPDTDVEDDAAEILDICLYNLLYKYHILSCDCITLILHTKWHRWKWWKSYPIIAISRSSDHTWWKGWRPILSAA